MLQNILFSWLLSVIIASFLASCEADIKRDYFGTGRHELTVLSQHGGMPNLFVSEKGKMFLSWVEFLNDSTDALYYSELTGEKWSAPRTIQVGTNWFVNWADFPSVAAYRDHNNFLVAHWLQMRGTGTYDYDVHIAQSKDGGRHWPGSFIPHRDGISAEHGFVSLVPLPNWKMFAVWLDGRKMTMGHDHDEDHGHSGPMTLRSAIFDTENRLFDERELDTMVCECCQTDAVMTRTGIAVVYRDRTDDEVRDISIVRLDHGKWTQPRKVYADNWKIAGCPVNGPAIASLGDTLAVAWFSAPGNEAQVKVSFSFDGGATFSSPVKVDEGKPLGRVDIILMDAEEAVVSWLEGGEAGARVLVSRVSPSGKKGASIPIAQTSESRQSGFPIMEKTQDKVILAWTEGDSATAVKTVMMSLR